MAIPRAGRFFVSLVFAVTPAAASERPPVPQFRTDPGCTWHWLTGGGVGLWGEVCNLSTGQWSVEWHRDRAAFVQTRDGAPVTQVLEIFKKSDEDPASAVLDELRRRGELADDEECVFQPAQVRAAPRTIAFLEIRPTGERLKAFEATPKDEIPDPPCGAYGWSTHGRRYFMTDIRQPDRVLYINEGQDGSMFDPASVTFTNE